MSLPMNLTVDTNPDGTLRLAIATVDGGQGAFIDIPVGTLLALIDGEVGGEVENPKLCQAPAETGDQLDLDAIEARAKAANVEARCACSWQGGSAYTSECPLHDPSSTIRHDRVAFESHAHDDVPALVAEVRRLRARLSLLDPTLPVPVDTSPFLAEGGA